MPQASDEQRELMRKWFGNSTDDYGPYKFLLLHGFYERAGMWYKPTPSYTVSIYEYACLNFLVDEWDYAYDFSFDVMYSELYRR
jgi:hypothetical protein